MIYFVCGSFSLMLFIVGFTYFFLKMANAEGPGDLGWMFPLAIIGGFVVFLLWPLVIPGALSVGFGVYLYRCSQSKSGK